MRHNVSIVIPCRNEEAFIEKAIMSVLNQSYTLGEFELLVVDGLSDDKTSEIIDQIAKGDSRLKRITNEKKITPAAMNLAIEKAQYDLLLRLDAHAVACPGFIQKSVEALLSDDSIACAGGKINNIYENQTSELVGAAMGSVFGVGNATFRVGGERSFVDTVAFGVFRKKVLEDVGGYDESLIRNEDDDLSYRIIAAGHKILYDPIIGSDYFVRASIKKLYRQYYQYGYWKVVVAKKHKTISTWRQMIPLFFVLGLFGGAILSLLIPMFWIAYASGVALYLLLAIVFGIRSSGKVMQGVKVALIFPVLHFSYGWGYLVGIIRFIIFRQKPARHQDKMSR